MNYYEYYAGRRVSGLSRMLQKRFVLSMAKSLRKLLNEKESIVEIGAGNGRLADELSQTFAYTGYEPSPALAAQLRSRGIAIAEKRVPPLQERDASVGAVLAFHVVEHLRDSEAVSLLFSEIFRVLKPGGIALIICPDFLDWGRVFFDFDYSHNYVTTANRLCQLSQDAGFAIREKRHLYGPLPFFPGFFLNLFVKLLFLPFEPFRGDFSFEIKGFWRARYLFTRAILVIATKPAGS